MPNARAALIHVAVVWAHNLAHVFPAHRRPTRHVDGDTAQFLPDAFFDALRRVGIDLGAENLDQGGSSSCGLDAG